MSYECMYNTYLGQVWSSMEGYLLFCCQSIGIS